MMHNLFTDDPIRRPIGRNSSRKSQRSSSSSDATSRRYLAEEAKEEIVEASKAPQNTMKTIAEEVKKPTMFKAFKFLATPIPPNSPPDELHMLTEYRAELKREYGSRFQQQPPPNN